MKLNLITHNVRGFNDPESIIKERYFLNSLSPRADIVHRQEHKLRGRALKILGTKLMHGDTSWIQEAVPGERSWINPDAVGKIGVGIILSNKYARLIKDQGSLYDNRVVWVKLKDVEGGTLRITCIYAFNIYMDRRHLWHVMVDSLPNDCEWIIGCDFNMTERVEDKSSDCGRAISDLEKFT